MEGTIIKKKHSAGITLVELIIVLAILAVCSTIALPDIATFSSGYRLKAAAREVATDLQFTRLLAVKENRTYQVVFGTNSYQVIRLSDGIVAKTRSFGPDYPDINLTNLSITFDPRGLSNGSTVTVANAKGVKNVSVSSVGRVMIE
jgi:prepilin-type N-terminal cleavage/methylation domain-containing protein